MSGVCVCVCMCECECVCVSVYVHAHVCISLCKFYQVLVLISASALCNFLHPYIHCNVFIFR